LPTDAGTISYHFDQTGDPHSGTFTLTKTGTARYDLLEHFKDVSNTLGGQTPGHMNFYPFGQAFVDPSIGTVAALTQMGGQLAAGQAAAAAAGGTAVGGAVAAPIIVAAVAIPVACVGAWYTGEWVGERIGDWWYPPHASRRQWWSATIFYNGTSPTCPISVTGYGPTPAAAISNARNRVPTGCSNYHHPRVRRIL
jgi:hypothetical protein